jgi:hypothetical protein
MNISGVEAAYVSKSGIQAGHKLKKIRIFDKNQDICRLIWIAV